MLVMILVLNVLLPVQTVFADETDSAEVISSMDTATPSEADRDPVISDKASPSEADEKETSAPTKETGKSSSKGNNTEISIATPSDGMKVPGIPSLLPELLLPVAKASGINVAGLLLDLKLELSQAENDDIDGGILAGKDFQVEGSFRVPVEGDGFPPE